MKILIVDDSIDKLSEVTKVIIDTKIDLTIKTVEDISGAISFLKNHTIDLLILDQFLPLKKETDSKILENGGYYLLKELYRNPQKVFLPKYIIGLSQYYEKCSNFSDIWMIIEYSPTHTKWHFPLINYLGHISKINSYQNIGYENENVVQTIYVEGLTDADLIKRVVECQFSEHKDKFIIESQKNAGANWVAQQLIIWGHQLKRNSKKELIKAIGLFDYDSAGIKAKKDALNKLTSSNQQEAVKVVNLLPKYSSNLIEYYKRGFQLEIEIESLLPTNVLEYADQQGWMENRTPLFIESPRDFDQMTETIPEYLKRIDLPSELYVYLKKVKLSKKEQFISYVLDESQKSMAILDNIKSLMDDVLKPLI